MILDDAEGDEIHNHGHEREQPGQRSDRKAQHRSHHTRTAREAECDKGQAASDRMQNHDARQGIGSIGTRLIESLAVNHGHDARRRVSNGFGEAQILIGRDGRDIENAVPEGSKDDAGIANIGVVCQDDFEDGEVFYHGGGDCGDEQEDGGCEEEDDSDPVAVVSDWPIACFCSSRVRWGTYQWKGEVLAMVARDVDCLLGRVVVV